MYYYILLIFNDKLLFNINNKNNKDNIDNKDNINNKNNKDNKDNKNNKDNIVEVIKDDTISNIEDFKNTQDTLSFKYKMMIDPDIDINIKKIKINITTDKKNNFDWIILEIKNTKLKIYKDNSIITYNSDRIDDYIQNIENFEIYDELSNSPVRKIQYTFINNESCNKINNIKIESYYANKNKINKKFNYNNNDMVDILYIETPSIKINMNNVIKKFFENIIKIHKKFLKLHTINTNNTNTNKNNNTIYYQNDIDIYQNYDLSYINILKNANIHFE